MAIKPMYHTYSHLDLGNTINSQGLQSMVKKEMKKRQKQILSKEPHHSSEFRACKNLQGIKHNLK